MRPLSILILSGSNRKDSATAAACRYIRERLARAGHDAVLFDLRERPLPFFSPDEPHAAHPDAAALVAAVRAADALVLGTPEYHGSVSGLLKNALDHLPDGALAGKAVLSLSAAGGAIGTSALTHLQAIVRTVHGVNSPFWISIGGPLRAFGADGAPENPKLRGRIDAACDALVDLASRLTAGR